jgi:GNAT superfamily N-acetyltransferase
MTLITDTVGGGAMQGTTIALTVVRPARAEDRRALRAMAERASDDTLWRRFHGGGRRVVDRELDRIVHPTDDHRSWVALSPDGAIHGTATLARGRDGTVEAAFLVEDGWFRRGIGRTLLTALVVEASHAGIDQLIARVQADNERAIRFLRGVWAGARASFVGDGEVEVVIPVPEATRAVSRSAA